MFSLHKTFITFFFLNVYLMNCELHKLKFILIFIFKEYKHIAMKTS